MIRVFEAFSGIGTQRMALRILGINHEVVAIADNLQSAIDRAFKLTPKKHRFDDDYVMKANVVSVRDILIDSEIKNEN